jgi:uncharacterized protein
MKLHQSAPTGINIFTHIEPGSFGINGFRHSGNIAVMPTGPVQSWTTATFATLSEADFAVMAGYDVDIVLLGTGLTLRFPPRQLMRPMFETGRGVEVMDTAAACRTFNILVAEGRKVGAFLLGEAPPQSPEE